MRFFAIAAAVAASLCFAFASVQAGSEFYILVGQPTDPPFGWQDFCARYAPECNTRPLKALDVVLDQQAWEYLKRVSEYINHSVKPLSDLDHWGVEEKWDYPDDGYGDCEDYVLAKRRMLLKAGWPRQALLITVVLDKKGDGHAVLTVKTDRGEYIADNERDDVVLWSQTGYRFLRRQSQTDPNEWVSVEEPALFGSIKW